MEEKDTFYEQLHTAQESLPKSDIVIVMGDINSKVEDTFFSINPTRHQPNTNSRLP